MYILQVNEQFGLYIYIYIITIKCVALPIFVIDAPYGVIRPGRVIAIPIDSTDGLDKQSSTSIILLSYSYKTTISIPNVFVIGAYGMVAMFFKISCYQLSREKAITSCWIKSKVPVSLTRRYTHVASQ